MNKSYANAAARIGNKINLASLAVPSLASNHIHLLENQSPNEVVPVRPDDNAYGFNPFNIGISLIRPTGNYDLRIDLVGREIVGIDQPDWFADKDQGGSFVQICIENIIRGELNYYKDRFQYDNDFHSAIKCNYRDYLKHTDILSRFNLVKQPLTFFILHMWQLLSQFTVDGTYAFTEKEIFINISRHHPKDPSTKEMSDINFNIAEGIDKHTFSIKNIPLWTRIVDFHGIDSSETKQRLLSKEPMLYVNTRDQEIGKRNLVLMLKFGIKHIVMVSMFSRQGYNLGRINNQNYKFKSLKKELNR